MTNILAAIPDPLPSKFIQSHDKIEDIDRIFPKFVKLLTALPDNSSIELMREKVGKLTERYSNECK